MGHVCTHDHFPGPYNEHPVVAVIAIIAILAAILLIAWARLEVHGTEDLEEALSEKLVVSDLPVAPAPDARAQEEREVDAAVTSSRFATGFGQ